MLDLLASRRSQISSRFELMQGFLCEDGFYFLALRGYVWVEPCHHAPTGRFGNGMSTLEQMSRM